MSYFISKPSSLGVIRPSKALCSIDVIVGSFFDISPRSIGSIVYSHVGYLSGLVCFTLREYVFSCFFSGSTSATVPYKLTISRGRKC